jgi:hypothetical protein
MAIVAHPPLHGFPDNPDRARARRGLTEKGGTKLSRYCAHGQGCQDLQPLLCLFGQFFILPV